MNAPSFPNARLDSRNRRPPVSARALRAVASCLLVLLVSGSPASAKKHKLTKDEVRLFTKIVESPLQKRKQLELDPILCVVARKYAKEMALKNHYAHIDRKGRGPNWRIRKAGYVLPSYYETTKTANNVESLVRTTGTFRYGFKLWKESPGHRIHVFGQVPFYKQQNFAGIGAYRLKSGTRERFYVFLTAHANESKKPPRVILLDPSGRILASTRKSAPRIPSL